MSPARRVTCPYCNGDNAARPCSNCQGRGTVIVAALPRAERPPLAADTPCAHCAGTCSRSGGCANTDEKRAARYAMLRAGAWPVVWFTCDGRTATRHRIDVRDACRTACGIDGAADQTGYGPGSLHAEHDLPHEVVCSSCGLGDFDTVLAPTDATPHAVTDSLGAVLGTFAHASIADAVKRARESTLRDPRIGPHASPTKTLDAFVWFLAAYLKDGAP